MQTEGTRCVVTVKVRFDETTISPRRGTDLVFELPPGAHDLRLLLASGDAETRPLIGHENSFFHGKTLFRLTA